MTNEPEKRIIIDEDWKTKVEREKEAASKEVTGSTASDAREPQAEKQPAPSESSGSQGTFRTASFTLLITTLATQAMVYLGQMPDPVDNQIQVDLPIAQHHIDLLAMLEEKTKGNLTSDEASLLSSILHELRMAFIYTKNSK